MNKNRIFIVRSLLLALFTSAGFVFGQATIRVRVVSVQVTNNVDCDGFTIPFFGYIGGNSDFVWEFTATDNTLGNSNNNPALFGLFGFNYAFNNNNNGPYTLTAPGGGFSPNSGLFFDYQYICATDVPSNVQLKWEAYDNDDAGNYDILGLNSGQTGLQTVNMPVPAFAGTSNYTFTATGSAGCQSTQTYVINLSVERIPLVVNYFDDAICNATAAAMNTTYTLGWCDYTLEPNEPAASDVQTAGSAWVKFLAPPSGSVYITTDLAGTDIGTYFEVYHAADGSTCGNGIQPITSVLVKDKFEYLSHVEFSDGIDFLGLDPEAEITFDSCDPFPGISYQKLIPGQTYYVQIAADNASDHGYFEFRVNQLGGSSPDLIDIPCLSNTVSPGTNAISSTAGSTATANLGFGCAFDGGNDYGETGKPHTSANPNQYHAYDYDHPAVNNAVMNESVWLNFIAPNNGRMIFETDYQSAIYSESAALFGFDARFSPGIPSDYNCANLDDLYANDGALNGLFGGTTVSAIIDARCLEPGYKYFGMVDPANNLTPLSTQNINTWLYDPSVVSPTTNPPGNDILCLAFADPLFEIPVTPAGTNPNFQAVAGTNEFACREYLAGEPAAAALQLDRADQTVWHYFVAPPSGSVEMNIRAYIGLDTLRYNVYELLNGIDCYGGLQPATYTQDGTRNTPIVTPMLTGSAGFEGTQESVCCLVPGKIYAIQLDGGSPGDEGEYIIEYVREVANDAGDVFVELSNGNTINVTDPDTAFVCFGDTIYPGIMVNGIGESTLDIPSCLSLGYVIHNTSPVPDPVSGSGFVFIDSVQTSNGIFVNNTNGSGTFGNPAFNQLYYVSPMADQPGSDWGTFSCSSAALSNGVPVVFLQPIQPVSSYDNALCTITFTASGGLATFNGSGFSYTISNAAGNAVSTGTFAAGSNIVYEVPSAEVFTVTVTDGSCPYSFTVDATACANPCVISPIQVFVDTAICTGGSIFLQGAAQTSAGLYTDVFTAANGCDSTIFTTLSINEPVNFAQTITICQGASYAIGTNTYTTAGIYTDPFVAANGCDSTVTTTLFVTAFLTSTTSQSICTGDSYAFGGNLLSTAGTFVDTLVSVQGCDSIATLFLTVLPNTTGSITATICEGQSYTFGTQTLTTSGAFTEVLVNANGCDSTVTLYLFVTNATETYQQAEICKGETYNLFGQSLTTSGMYIDTTTTAAGCDSIVRLELSVIDCVGDFEISNMVTPNDDGQNDTWKINNYPYIAGCTVTVYNRWGQPVYTTNDYHNEWAGTKDGELLPDGVYFYSIKCSDEDFTGSINLFRFKK